MCAGNAFTNFLLAGSLNQLWGMINNLQIVIHSPLINVQFPGNAYILYDNMIVIATFDFLDENSNKKLKSTAQNKWNTKITFISPSSPPPFLYFLLKNVRPIRYKQYQE